MNFYQAIQDRIQGKAPKGAKRSSKWRKVRKIFLASYPYCAVCSSKKKLEVHHIVPFHVAPDLELAERNLVTLCKRCHLFIGHLGDYRCINTVCAADVILWAFKFGGRNAN